MSNFLNKFCFLRLIKYSLFSLCLTLFFFFVQACSCGNTSGDPNASDNEGRLGGTPNPLVDGPAKPTVKVTEDSIPLVYNSADGFIGFLPEIFLKITGARFDKAKIESTSKPCENAITFSVQKITTQTPETLTKDNGLDKEGSISCSYVDASTVKLIITPPDIDTTDADLSLPDAVLHVDGNPSKVPLIPLSAEPTIQLALDIDFDDTYVSDIKDEEHSKTNLMLKLKAKAAGVFTDESQKVADYGKYGFIFHKKIFVIDVDRPDSFLSFAPKYVGISAGISYEFSWTGVQSPVAPYHYYLFERDGEKNAEATYNGYFHQHIIKLNKIDLDFVAGTATINPGSWETRQGMGGFLTTTLKQGIFVNHNAAFHIGVDGEGDILIGLHGGYNHNSHKNIDYNLRNPIIKTVSEEIVHTVPDMTNDIDADASHNIFEVIPIGQIYLKVGKHNKPFIKQFKYNGETTAPSFHNVAVTGYTPTDLAFKNGAKVLRVTEDGNAYFYVLGEYDPFVGTVTRNENIITGVHLERIVNPLNPLGPPFGTDSDENSNKLDNTFVLYNKEKDVLIAYISRNRLNTETPAITKIFIGRFDDSSDSTPTWTRRF